MLALPILDDQHWDLLDRQATFFGASATMSGLAWQLTLTFEGLQEVGLVFSSSVSFSRAGSANIRWRQRNEVVRSTPDS